MEQRVAGLADQFEAVHREVVTFCQALSSSDWETYVPNEERTVGVLIQHIAIGYGAEAGLIRAIVNGQPLPAIYASWDALNAMNARDAVALRSGTQAEALQLLDLHASETSQFLRTLTDDDLGKSQPLGIRDGELWTVERVIRTIVLGHPRWHMASIRSTLADQATEHRS